MARPLWTEAAEFYSTISIVIVIIIRTLILVLHQR
jgi:hypothetical protein